MSMIKAHQLVHNAAMKSRVLEDQIKKSINSSCSALGGKRNALKYLNTNEVHKRGEKRRLGGRGVEGFKNTGV